MTAQLSKHEFGSIIREPKYINGNIEWGRRENNRSVSEFRVDIVSEWPLFLHATFNPDVSKLNYLIVHKKHGRIFGVDLGKEHHNPHCNMVGETHLHEWTEEFRDKVARVPEEITAEISNPVAVWQQFCELANITHTGILGPPLPRQEELFI